MGGPAAERGGAQDNPVIGAIKFDSAGNLLTFDGTEWTSLELVGDLGPETIIRGAPEYQTDEDPAAGTDDPRRD